MTGFQPVDGGSIPLARTKIRNYHVGMVFAIEFGVVFEQILTRVF